MIRRTVLQSRLLASVLLLAAAPAASIAAENVPDECKAFSMASYGGPSGEPHRFFLADPFQERWGVTVDLLPTSSSDILVQIKAATGRPPVETIPLDVGPQITWSKEGVLQKTPTVEQVPNLADVYPEYMPDTYGYGVPATYSIIGIAYNPQLVKTPPTSWADLWKPEYKGLVGIPTPVSSLGRGFVWMAGKLNGGDEKSVEPAFDKLKALEGNLAAIAPNPPGVATLFERGEIAIAPLWNNNTAILKAKGVPVEWVSPSEGAIVVQSNMNAVAGAPCEPQVLDYLNRVLSVEYQTKAAAAPYFFGPTNRKVVVPDSSKAYLPSTPEEVAKLIHIDWAAWDVNREAIIDRFNKEITPIAGK